MGQLKRILTRLALLAAILILLCASYIFTSAGRLTEHRRRAA